MLVELAGALEPGQDASKLVEVLHGVEVVPALPLGIAVEAVEPVIKAFRSRNVADEFSTAGPAEPANKLVGAAVDDRDRVIQQQQARPLHRQLRLRLAPEPLGVGPVQILGDHALEQVHQWLPLADQLVSLEPSKALAAVAHAVPLARDHSRRDSRHLLMELVAGSEESAAATAVDHRIELLALGKRLSEQRLSTVQRAVQARDDRARDDRAIVHWDAS